MSFLGDLADSISSQFSLGENDTHSLDAVVDGQNVKYGSLGDFASKIDQSAQRNYVEEGYLRRDPYNTDTKRMEILFQEPDATVLIKKKMFSSIGENFRSDFMDRDEKLYYKAVQILFKNKCQQISAIEKLCKIQKVTSAVGSVEEQLLPVIMTLSDTLKNGIGSSSNQELFGNLSGAGSSNISKFTRTIDKLRKAYAFNTTSNLTTWITDPLGSFNSQFGNDGTGVIEITNFTNFTTRLSTNLNNPGTFSLNIVDPYELMLITEYDVERAISDASSAIYSHKSFQFGIQSAEHVINNAQVQLNQIRNARKASPITIKVNPDTLLGRRVTAIVDRVGLELVFQYDSTGGTGFPGLGGAGNSVTVSPEYLKNGFVLGFDGLDTGKSNKLNPESNIKKLFPESELDIFKRLIAAIYNKIQLEVNSRNAIQTNNEKTNYARRKLRNFAGKLIIQPMDIVHIFINTKSRYDSKLMTGINNMFSGAGILQNLNKTVTDLKNAFDVFSNPNGSLALQAEKSIYVGSDFPNFLWSLIRTQFVTEKEGTHVFAGVVEGANESWSAGSFSVTVSGKDNTYYFDQGKINFKPGVDNFNGLIYDPLTPFKSKFDRVATQANADPTELLEENKYLLSEDGKSSLAKHKLGPFAGEKVNAYNYLQDKSVDPTTGLITKNFYAPDGLVYRWKEGIGVFTQFGSSTVLNDSNKVGNPNTFAEPFAGLDVMNVISLLITGVPYNYENYYKVTQNTGGFSRDPQSQQDAAYSYANSLKNDLSQLNVLWGNFIPFKNLILDEASYSKMNEFRTQEAENNKILEVKLQKLSELHKLSYVLGIENNRLNVSNGELTSKGSNDLLTRTTNEIGTLKTEINDLLKQPTQAQDTAFIRTGQSNTEFDDFNDDDAMSNPAVRRNIRKQANYLTRRMSYNIRANEDKNLFIVDDFYDKDFDIVAYNQGLTDGIRLFNNDFSSVREKIKQVADLLNLEVFCDTQGHIRIRPPQYNRMHSSVFYRMLYLKKALNIQVYPAFLEEMFSTQLDTLRARIEVIEDQIRLFCAILGKKASIDSDKDSTEFLKNDSQANKGQGGTFSFISNPDGIITDISEVLRQANPDLIDPSFPGTFNKITTQSSNKNIFDNSARISKTLDILTVQRNQAQGIPSDTTAPTFDSSLVNDLIERLQTASGQLFNPKDYILDNSITLSKSLEIPNNSNKVDIFKITNELYNKIQERQSVLKLFYATIKNNIAFKSLDDNPNDQTGNQLLTPGINRNSHIPEIFEHLIEDESDDDYGLGSGKRYVIKRAQIIQLSISENPPPFTGIEVKGVLNPLAPNALPGGFDSFPSGGNGFVTAMAIDYDLWRNYGYRESPPISVPFLSDPASQCAPFASMILSRNRKNILRGSITISGNEFMQPGEVVFLEDRGLLFYVESISHTFTMGRSFTTSLELTYGHTPGEYIPTFMDMIGKLIYKNKEIADLVVHRQDSSGNDSNLGVIRRYAANSSVLDTFSKSAAGSPTTQDTGIKLDKLFRPSDVQVMSNIMYTVKRAINSNTNTKNTIKAKVELRLYKDQNKFTSVNSDLKDLAEQVIKVLTGEAHDLDEQFGKYKNPPIQNSESEKNVEIVEVDLDDQNNRRSPSQKAFDAARLAQTVRRKTP